MTNREELAALLPTPFVSSWAGRARPGDRVDPNPARRAGAWAHWAIENLTQMTGAADRVYTALLLEGRFHDPKGNGPLVRPHLELPDRVLSRPDSEFPDRLAQAGNGLMFPWWLYYEVTAAKRALCPPQHGSVATLADLVNERRGSLIEQVSQLARHAAPRWQRIEELLVTEPDGLSEVATADFDEDAVAAFLPAAARVSLRVEFDRKLAETSKGWASRRVGVWHLRGVDSTGADFSLGVLTPRLTQNSQFHDRLYALDRESPAALLVRGLQLQRICDRHLDGTRRARVADPASAARPSGFLRRVEAKVGEKLPEASVRAADAFLREAPDADAAWAMLSAWADKNQTLLTVSKEGFCEAHRRATRFVRRGEPPEREDIDVLLPIGWDSSSRIVRLTFVKAAD